MYILARVRAVVVVPLIPPIPSGEDGSIRFHLLLFDVVVTFVELIRCLIAIVAELVSCVMYFPFLISAFM